MSDLLAIMSLQETDDALDAMRASVAQARLQLEGDPELAAAGERRDSLRAELDSRRKAQRALEVSIQDLDTRIARDVAHMYDGSIKTARDLTTLEHEVEGLRQARSRLEDEALELITEAESLASGLEECEATVAALEAGWATTAVRLRGEETDLERRIAAAEAERAQRLTAVSAGNARLYEGLRKRKGPNVVVRVNGAICGGCRVAIPDPVRRRIINSPSLVQCPHCERILAPG